MTLLLAFASVTTWGTWMPLSHLVPGVPQRSRVLYATAGNLLLALVVLVGWGGRVEFGWRGFWLPLAGGMLWTGGSYCGFRAAGAMGLARAAGTWTSLNIVVAFLCGAAFFGELNHFTTARYVELVVALAVMVAGVLLIVGAQGEADGGSGGSANRGAAGPGTQRSGTGRAAGTALRDGLPWALGAGVLWGCYFVPAQWAGVPTQVSDFPLALGMLVAALALAFPAGEPVRLAPLATGTEMAAGVIWGIGNLSVLGLVERVGSGTGFTIAQLALLVNASLGIWAFRTPAPGTRHARRVLAGIVVAGTAGCIIGAMR